jgi:TPR repeat protein
MKKLLAALVILTTAFQTFAGPYEDGIAAYDRGDYANAARLMKIPAQQGYAPAQFNLGVMYFKGLGIPQDYAEAFRWYKMAAQQGYAPAQYNLGVMYAKGQGIPQDYARAYLWYNLAAIKGDTDSVKNRDIFAKRMTSQQIAEAQKMARECLESNYKKCD